MASIFRLHFEEDKYPVSRLVVYRARMLGLTRSDLARKFGYRDLGDAHKALASVLKTGTVPAHMRNHLGTALELDESVIDSVIEATSRQRQDEWRASLLAEEKKHMARFRPHLRTETARTVPQPIFCSGTDRHGSVAAGRGSV